MKSVFISFISSLATLTNPASSLSISRLSHVTSPSNLVSRTSIWQPAVGMRWQIVLQTGINVDNLQPANVSIWDIDLFSNTQDGKDNTKIQKLKAAGKMVICYFNAGAYQPDTPDAKDFDTADMGNELVGWPGERWLRTNSSKVRAIMSSRIALAAKMGCDAIDPDNIDAYDNKNGLGLISQDAIEYVKFLAAEAVKNNLAIGLKNAGKIASSVMEDVQFCVQEQCVAQKNCKQFNGFITAGKPVFHIEYVDDDGTDGDDIVDRDNGDGEVANDGGETDEEGADPDTEEDGDDEEEADSSDSDERDENETGDNEDAKRKRADIPSPQTMCDGSDVPIPSFSTVIKKLSLDGWVQYCDGTTATTITDK